MPSPLARRRLQVALIGLVVLVTTAATGWALVTHTRSGRHLAAASLRRMLGPPNGSEAREESRPAPMAIEGPAPLHADPTASANADEQAADDEPEGPVASADVPATRLEPPPGMRGVSFLLLLGMDKSHPKVLGRTDAMIVVAFRHRDGAVAAFSIPRDLWVPLDAVPDRGAARINAVARVGDVRVGPGEGLPLLRQVIHRELGIRIDHYALIDFSGFESLVDAVDGVDVDVACPIMDCFWVDGPDAPCRPMNIDAGRQHLDGQTALAFVRSRHGTGTRDRRQRQQAVMVGFAREVRGKSLPELRALWRVAEPFVQTDLDWRAAAYYASFALDHDLDDVHGFDIKSPMVRKFVTEDKKHVITLDHDAFDAAFADLFDAPLPALQPRTRCPEADAALTYRSRRNRRAKSR